MTNKIMYITIAIALGAGLVNFILNWQHSRKVDIAPIACTADAKQCSDGTYVGRSGPNCEFVCPDTSGSTTTY